MAKGENRAEPASPEPVSIIVPCLNEEHYIGKLLSCLSKQTFQDFEIIIVDGGSTDNTQGAADRTIAAHPSLRSKVSFVIADKRGTSYQRNFGVARAHNRRLLFLDADVQVPPSFLLVTLEEMTKRNLLLATVEFEPISRRVDDHFIYMLGNMYVKAQQYMQPVAMGFCIFSTKQVHDMTGGFLDDMKVREDYDYIGRAGNLGFMLRVLRAGKVYISIRRLNKEGRFTYYKKAILPELKHILSNKKMHEYMEYEFGNFDKDPEADALDLSEK